MATIREHQTFGARRRTRRHAPPPTTATPCPERGGPDRVQAERALNLIKQRRPHSIVWKLAYRRIEDLLWSARTIERRRELEDLSAEVINSLSHARRLPHTSR